MSEGLVTRIGQWMDRKWEKKATEGQVVAVSLEAGQAIKTLSHDTKEWIAEAINAMAESDQKIAGIFRDAAKKFDQDVMGLRKAITDIEIVAKTPQVYEKEVADLKTRIEKLEIYSGFGRKIDPTKPPVVKSAFSM
jgi:hypothetical protein